ncbi:MAG: MoxR family ATPase [Armatimonadetes bacterium]|nr:MoxR family ATPase [Armatimonadota bacterium]
MSSEGSSADFARVAEVANRLIKEVEKVIVGKKEAVTHAVLALLCNGHALIEDIPGVGKTTLSKALAKSMNGIFSRVQFTPDLLPADVTGSSIFNQKTGDFEFRQGPVFGNVVLVDEINRATPKTQSALLEAMEERQVTADGITHKLPIPFFVIATQNNIEMTGTYPLPEAQLDRFFARISLGYPERDAEIAILEHQQTVHPLESVRPVVTMDDLMEMQRAVTQVFVRDRIREYVVDLVRATRENNQLLIGASPRGALHLVRAAQAHAVLNGFDFVRPEDVKAVAAIVLSHRILPRAELRARGSTAEQVIHRLLETVPAPVPEAN